jgi:hypothetical protein
MDMGAARMYQEAYDRTEQYKEEHPNHENIGVIDVFGYDHYRAYGVDPSSWERIMINGPGGGTLTLQGLQSLYSPNGYGNYSMADDRVYYDYGGADIANPPDKLTPEAFKEWYRERIDAIRQAMDAGIDLVARLFPETSTGIETEERPSACRNHPSARKVAFPCPSGRREDGFGTDDSAGAGGAGV